jgi:hypothetical protein
MKLSVRLHGRQSSPLGKNSFYFLAITSFAIIARSTFISLLQAINVALASRSRSNPQKLETTTQKTPKRRPKQTTRACMQK